MSNDPASHLILLSFHSVILKEKVVNRYFLNRKYIPRKQIICNNCFFLHYILQSEGKLCKYRFTDIGHHQFLLTIKIVIAQALKGEHTGVLVLHFLVIARTGSTSLVAQTVKNLLAMQEVQVRSLSRDDPVVKGMATTLVFLPEEMHGWRSLVGYSPWSHKEVDMTE